MYNNIYIYIYVYVYVGRNPRCFRQDLVCISQPIYQTTYSSIYVRIRGCVHTHMHARIYMNMQTYTHVQSGMQRQWTRPFPSECPFPAWWVMRVPVIPPEPLALMQGSRQQPPHPQGSAAGGSPAPVSTLASLLPGRRDACTRKHGL